MRCDEPIDGNFIMHKPDTDADSVRMEDVLCDFCQRHWTVDQPMIEGHQGSCMCGRCLTIAYTEVVLNDVDCSPEAFKCPMCLEDHADREALSRAGEAGWQSPVDERAVICRRCIELAAKTLEKNRDFDWKRPPK